MTVTDDEQLLEIGRFMTAFNANFLPEDYATRTEYTFQLLEATLDHFGLHTYWEFFFKTLLFDAIIGNTDRHQENWAFIGKNTLFSDVFKSIETDVKKKGFKNMGWLFQKSFNKVFDKDKNEFNIKGKSIILDTLNIAKPAPIFDSGSSMARELNENRINLLLSNPIELEKYIANGKTELHWKNNKVSHYSLIEELLNSSHVEQIMNAAKFLEKWDTDFINTILLNTGKQVPKEWESFCIPDNRKELIVKLLTLRFQRLHSLINGRVR